MSKTKKTHGIKKNPIYSNCVMQGPDGAAICRIGDDRADWYLRNKLATVVGENPKTIRLAFEPKGPGRVGEPYYMAHKHNRCVVCGCEDDLTRHHCVPYEYRQYFPKEWKCVSSHDIFPLCCRCHHAYEVAAQELRDQLAVEFEVAGESVKVYNKQDYSTGRLINAVLEWGHRIPVERLTKMYSGIASHFGRTEVKPEELPGLLAKIDAKPVRAQYIVEHTTDLNEFNRRWRQHFVDTMKPEFLPDHWAVDYKPVRLLGQ